MPGERFPGQGQRCQLRRGQGARGVRLGVWPASRAGEGRDELGAAA